MDTYLDSVNIVNNVISSVIDDLSIARGDDNELEAHVNVEEKTIVFPYYQEPLLILDQLGTKKQFLCFYLALKMLQNDDYESCNELMCILENEGIPENENGPALYKEILLKQLFILFHECGHYINETKQEFKDYFNENLRTFPNEYPDVNLDEEKKQILDLYNEFCEGNTLEILKDYFTNFNFTNNLKTYFNNQNCIDESAADCSAIYLIDEFLNTREDYLNGISIKKMICEAVYFVNKLCTLEMQLNLGVGTDMLDQKSFIEKQGYIYSGRYPFILVMINQCMDDEDAFEIDFINQLRENLSGLYLLTDYKKYCDSWLSGSVDNESDNIKYNLTKERINKYVESLKKLFVNNNTTYNTATT